MFNTFKLCNMRDCHSSEVEPVPFNAVDPCTVFLHLESNVWYDELTGSVVPMHQHGDGQVFDTQAWLLGQAQNAMSTWQWGNKVHEPYKRHALKSGRTRPGAFAPEHTNEQLDGIVDNFIRNPSAGDTLLLKSIGKEIQAYVRMQKKWNNHPMVEERLAALRAHRKVLMDSQSLTAETSDVAIKHLKADKQWIDRWVPKKTNWKDFALVWEDPKSKSVWCIDRHGFKLRGHYIYLTDRDKDYIESANHAERVYGIKRTMWKKIAVTAESIGKPLRSVGKKNSNGGRIAARFDHKKYAETCITLVKQMRLLGINVDKFVNDNDLYEYYLKNIVPKLQSR